MEQFETILQNTLVSVSRMLDPAMLAFARLDATVRQELAGFGVPFNWVGTVVTTAWVIAAFLLVRALPGLLRLVALLLIGLMVLKAYGVLPGA